ncbi:hypothetical protein AtDm6_0269 [Acetobacter tropicalis]|uniref:Uncharacterized protein n=1 Tax=Acetobacter tropicalis TaxID=104102 RepID=A0A094YY39_9PROT|nr:hypothetical protein AtDm6_0269 [Acetobacter tropicalis]
MRRAYHKRDNADDIPDLHLDASLQSWNPQCGTTETQKDVISQAATGSGKFNIHFGSDYRKTKAANRITSCKNGFSWKKSLSLDHFLNFPLSSDAVFLMEEKENRGNSAPPHIHTVAWHERCCLHYHLFQA